MILQSTLSNQVAAPDSYAAFSSAIIGKPLALVNIGYSLELAGAENTNWSTVNTQGPDLHLLQPDGSPFAAGAAGGYTFPVKIGDVDRTYDGLVGYFNTPTSTSSSDLNLSSIYTYYPSSTTPQNGDPRVPISASPSNFPLFTPYYKSSGKAGDPITDQAINMQVFGTIMDPFLPVHAYSVILPNKPLSLPNWTVEQGLKNINAFWKIGPLLVADDVPATYDPTRALNSNSTDLSLRITAPAGTTAQDPTLLPPKIALPLNAPVASASGGDAKYRYLQPYVVSVPDLATGAVATTTTEYNVFGISGDAASGADAVQARLPDGPYTAVEGYAQVVRVGGDS